MDRQRTTLTFAIFFAVLTMATAAHPDENEPGDNGIQVSLRANVLLGDGIPANDILGVGVIGRYDLNNGWFAGAALDAYEYDWEHAARTAGFEQDPAEDEIDALASSTVLSGYFGRLYGQTNAGFDWFWSAGLGVGFPEVDDFSGTSSTGAAISLSYDASTEIHVMGTLGTSYHFSPTWSATFAARVEHHFMDVTSTDAISGAKTNIDSQSPIGAYISIDFKF